jgi:hypothetical protein
MATKVDHAPLHEVLAAWLHIQNLPVLQESVNQRLKVKLEAMSEALQDDYRTYAAIHTRSSAGKGTCERLRMRCRLNWHHVIPWSKRSRSTIK